MDVLDGDLETVEGILDINLPYMDTSCFNKIACPSTMMVAKMASIVVGGQPNHTIRLIILLITSLRLNSRGMLISYVLVDPDIISNKRMHLRRTHFDS